MSAQVEVTVSPASQAQAQIFGPGTTTVVEVQAPALQQPIAAIRVDAETSGAIYTGRASYGSSESSPVWTVTRSLFNPAGIRTAKGTAVNVTWAARASATYT